MKKLSEEQQQKSGLETLVISEQPANRRKVFTSPGFITFLTGATADTASTLAALYLVRFGSEENNLVNALAEKTGPVAGQVISYGLEVGLIGLSAVALSKSKFVKHAQIFFASMGVNHMLAALNNTIVAVHPSGAYSAVEKGYLHTFSAYYHFLYNPVPLAHHFVSSLLGKL